MKPLLGLISGLAMSARRISAPIARPGNPKPSPAPSTSTHRPPDPPPALAVDLTLIKIILNLGR